MPVQIEAADEFLINFEATADQFFPSITALPDGRFLATWVAFDTTQDGDVTAIKARLFNENGIPVLPEFLVNTEFTNDQFNPAITSLPDGGFVIVWQTSDATQDGTVIIINGIDMSQLGNTDIII